MNPLRLCVNLAQKVSMVLLRLVQPATPAKLAPTTTKVHRLHLPLAKFVYLVRIKIPQEVHHAYCVHLVQR